MNRSQSKNRIPLTRRDMLRNAALAAGVSSWMPAFANAFADDPKRQRHCILLWMTGGPSQIDTFDLKPEHANGGEFKPIDTNAPGLQISEHLPKLAKHGDQLAVIRSMSTKEGDHGRGTYLMRTGHQPGGLIQYPTLGSLLSKELAPPQAEMPDYISISPYRVFNRSAFQPGFLGPRHAALTVGAADSFQPQQQQDADSYAELGVDDLFAPDSVTEEQVSARLSLLTSLQDGFVSRHSTASAISHRTVYERAVRMMKSEAAQAFDLEKEEDAVRDAYGRGRFGQGCLMARRLVESGVPFVEVSLGGLGGGALGWDTHQNNFARVKELSAELDAGWSTLMSELKERGLLETTTIVWMGEFGRTPQIRRPGAAAGRDHYPAAWTTVLAGGGIKGGQAFGKTSADGASVAEGKVDVPDMLATLCKALGIDPGQQNISELGRPISIAEGKVIEDIVA
ncbi:MAG: DUF1501 domain-containing protein [Planctomycetaceae bacterium]|jgi:uncharacterized protein (DUF1501 family)|nr:DUF1501 domain-containing protein [Planctomycetaceae bacterium]MBT6156944.1 DUF1501 domain-containing protein [Planctomycetaceae bacterium]MBT6484487.1 DUF1501 domain-containing protein [Planctomycetaceae bacterium]MBT6498135.1 DUF1501 domain-containing protein [Planctomycetaceae bacterium]